MALKVTGSSPVGQLFAWGDLTESEYRRQKTEVERDLALLPDDDKLVLFDHHRRLMVSTGENVAAATPEQLRELILMLVEHAETRDRGWRRPMDGTRSIVLRRCGVASPDGSGDPTTTALDERLAAYA